jgi:ADP-ribose pyrophosphatase YjhB (NUDIX family)
MNKKVYFNNKFLLLTTEDIQPNGNQLIVKSEDLDADKLNERIKNFIQQNDGGDLIFICKDVNTSFEEIKKQFKYIEAAGGLIRQNQNYLFIYRLGKWDLPKGKLDEGETPAQAAIRECEEECGITQLEIIEQLPSTYHIYYYKNRYALKQTYWYLMKSSHNATLVPQTSENIEKVEWLDESAVKNTVVKNTYPSVLDLIFVTLPH